MSNCLNDSSSKEPLALRSETLAYLKEFINEQGIPLQNNNDNSDEEDPEDVLHSLSKYFEDPNKDDVFIVDYTSIDEQRTVYFEVKGIKRELGQTLNSTGLTM